MPLLHCTWLYITLPCLYFTLIDSTLLYHGSTSLYLSLQYSTIFLLHSLIYLFHLMKIQFSLLTVHIEIQQCPLGFKFSNRSQTCICHPKLQQHEINCSIDTQTVYRRSPLWINAAVLNETYTQVLIHNHCPFDYCKDGNMHLNMEHPDEQCAFSCSDVLCGSCQQNLSHVLGTSNCKEFSSHFLLLIILYIYYSIEYWLGLGDWNLSLMPTLGLTRTNIVTGLEFF